MQDIGEQQLLMLLFMMQADLNDRSKLGQVVCRQVICRFDQPHHRGVDVTTVGSDFIGAWSCDQTPLLAGDTVDIAFTVGHNDHPEYGGLELTLRDFKILTPE